MLKSEQALPVRGRPARKTAYALNKSRDGELRMSISIEGRLSLTALAEAVTLQIANTLEIDGAIEDAPDSVLELKVAKLVPSKRRAVEFASNEILSGGTDFGSRLAEAADPLDNLLAVVERRITALWSV